MNAPPFPTNPSTGQWFGNWVWNGARWVCTQGGMKTIMTVYYGPTTAGPAAQFTYMPSPGLVSLIVECVGGGGAGGSVYLATGYTYGGASGGGSGGYSRSALPAALVLGGVIVTVGAGSPPPVRGSYGVGLLFGGPTSFGALVYCNGGETANNFDPGGVGSYGEYGRGATAGGDYGQPLAIGDYVNQGSLGNIWTTIDVNSTTRWAQPGQGGVGYNGGGGNPSNPNGVPGSGNGGSGGWGAGGQGAQSNDGVDYVGGAGSPGVCIVTEYCWANEDDCLNPPVNVNARVAIVNDWPGPGPCPPGWGQQSQVGYDRGGYEE